MNRATKAALLVDSQAINPFQLSCALFHSTPVLDRRRRTHWDSGRGAYKDSSKRYNHYCKRSTKFNAKENLLRNVSAFAEHLFQIDHDDFYPFSRKESSWFGRDYQANGSKGGRTNKEGPPAWSRRGFQFCGDDDIEVETIFRSAFCGNGNFYWSFIDEEPRWRSSSGYSNTYRTSWKSRLEDEEEYDSSTESDSSESDLTSDRLSLGLNASGPLSIEDVKNAYRACALKWHPDRHQGSSKAVAEEKFKVCSAAYQSLCDNLAVCYY